MVVERRGSDKFGFSALLLQRLSDRGFHGVKLRHRAHEEEQRFPEEGEEVYLRELGGFVPAKGRKAREEVGEYVRLQ